MKLSDLKARVHNENEGVWLTYEGDFELKIGSTASHRFRETRQRMIRERTAAIREQGLSALTEDDLQELYATGVVLDLRGLEDDDGNPILFSPERVIELFDADYGLYNWVCQCAEIRAIFKARQIEDAEKNSPASCAGNCATESTNRGMKTSRGRES